jgi:hypothetical protein
MHELALFLGELARLRRRLVSLTTAFKTWKLRRWPARDLFIVFCNLCKLLLVAPRALLLLIMA